MKKPDSLRGVGTVYRYSMQQHYKTTSVRVFLIILFVLAVAAFPLIRLMSGGGATEVDSTSVKRLYIRNETPFAMIADDIHADSRYAEIEVENTESDLKTLSKILNEEKSAVAAVVKVGSTGLSYSVDTYYGSSSDLSYDDVYSLTNVIKEGLHQAMLRTMDITEAQESLLSSKTTVMVSTAADYHSGTITETDTGTNLLVNTFYAYFIMILSGIAMGYIFQICMEEKVSKLVESLLVSVSPTALLIGKLLAVTCMIFGGLAMIAFGLFISYQIAKNTGSVAFIDKGFASMGLELNGLHFGLSTVLLLILCLLLAYAICASLAGICGSCCSKTEDTQQASMVMMLVLVVGYMVGALTPMLESDAVNYFCAIFPITSIFSALPNFICGKIGLPIFLLALVLQAATAFFLANVAGKVYRMMLLYRGSVPKPAQLIRMLRETKQTAGKEDAHEA